MRLHPVKYYSILELTISICIVLVFLAIVPQVQAQVQYPYYVPAKERVTRINIERLPLTGYAVRETGSIQKIEESYALSTVKDFIETPNRQQDCQSVLREGFQCFELENTQIGYSGQIDGYYPFPISGGYFRTIDRRSKILQVFYNAEKNHFFVRPSKEVDKIYGPFKGEPLTELKNAEFPVKERTSFEGVKFKYVSKRWEFPDEKDVMLDRKSAGYDLSGGSLSGRQVEGMRLNSQFVRFRLENNSGQNLFLLYFGDEPEVFQLDRFPKWISWRTQSQPKFNAGSDYNLNNLNWVSLPKNAAIEFETKAKCDIRQTCAICIYLNDDRSFWDEVETIAVYPSNKKREFSPENAPPSRK